MKIFLILGAVILVLSAGVMWWSGSAQPNDSDIISTTGIHWHPELTILVKGEAQVIPPNIGIGAQYSSYRNFDKQMGMTAIHTHDDADRGIIHFEFSGTVREADLTLGRFLAVWGKDIDSFGKNPRMTVNGTENTELQDYVMRDKDKIVLDYD